MEVGAELFDGSAQPGAGGDRWWQPGQGHSAAVPGQRVLHYKALGRRSSTGETEARPQRNQQVLKLKDHHGLIAAEVALRPDVTLNELRAWLLATHGLSASLGLMHQTLARLRLTLKKSRAGRRSRIGPMSPSGASPGGPGKAR